MNNQQMREIILNKKFTKSLYAGYETSDVDKFFDIVIDYLIGNDIEVAKFKKDNEALLEENKKLNGILATKDAKIAELEMRIKQFEDDGFNHVIDNRKMQEEIDKKKHNKGDK